MTHASLLPMRLWQVGVPAFAAIVGLLAGVAPMFAVAAALGVLFVVLVLADLAIGIALFVLVAFLEGIGDLGALSLAKLAGALLAFSWLVSNQSEGGERRELIRDHPVAFAALAGMATWATVSVLWSEIPANALDAGTRWALNMAMFPIVYAGVRSPRHVHWIFSLFVFGALLSAAVGVLEGTASATGEARLEGSGVNANELGELLIVAVILAASLGACRDISVPGRALAFAGSAAAIVALLMTVSRGAMSGLAVALVLTPFLVGPARRLTALALVVCAVGAAGAYLVAIAPEAAVERITQSDSSGTGRTDIWKVGLRIVEDKPVLGVGAGNYANSTIHYLLEPGAIARPEFIVDHPKVPHNIFLQVIAELGFVGFVFFASVLLFALGTTLRAARLFGEAGDRSLELLTRGLLIALVGLLSSAFFSSAIYSKQLWLLLALGVALERVAKDRAGVPALASARRN